jgi:hypothetical protein
VDGEVKLAELAHAIGVVSFAFEGGVGPKVIAEGREQVLLRSE